MKFTQILTATALAACTMLAHADNGTIGAEKTPETIDSTREVAYVCKMQVAGKLVNQKMTAMYGIKDNEIVVAQLKINNEVSPGMWRDNFIPMNRFVSQDKDTRTVAWTTLPANADNVTKVDGGKYSVAESNGAQHSIILDNCKLDSAATAKLAR